MATSRPDRFDGKPLRARVRIDLERLARQPNGGLSFQHGRDYAANYLRYDPEELAQLPKEATARFSGVGNPLRIGPIGPGQTVLDHACGAGMDLLLAARRTGRWGRAIGVDMTAVMRDQAIVAAAKAQLSNIVEVRAGMFEDLPVEDESIDVVISNGAVALVSDKARVFGEIRRVLRPGGRLFLATVVVQRELKLATRHDLPIWAARIAGALSESALHRLLAGLGFTDGQIVERFDCFRHIRAPLGPGRDAGAQGVNFFARKPECSVLPARR
jgi:arsenite methyltransferase